MFGSRTRDAGHHQDGNGAACKQYERIAFNGVTMMFSPSFDDSVNSLHKLCSEITEELIREGYPVVAIAEFCSATEAGNLSN